MKKIMFNDNYALTQAVLERRKTQTRRIVYDGDIEKPRVGYGLHNAEDKCILHENWRQVAMSRYKIGEEVAVAQRYSECNRAVFLLDSKGWKNKMFVKAELMPHRIKIANIRIERLQDISEEDCLKEGVSKIPLVGDYTFEIDKVLDSSRWTAYRTPRAAFAALIDKVSGKGTWDSNPWVFVYDFELIK